MKKSQKLLVASLVTLPVAVVMAGGVQAAETVKPVETVLPPLEISNSFITKSTTVPVTSTEDFPVKSKDELHAKLLEQMQGFKNGFTITYDGTAESYKTDVEEFFEGLKTKLNTIEGSLDYTLLYGAFKNVKVDATEVTATSDTKKKIKLEFSFSYSDAASQEELAEIVNHLTTPTSAIAIIKNDMSPLQKIKAVNDYIVLKSSVDLTETSLLDLFISNKGSSNTYALATYKLLKAAGIEVRYVAGLSGNKSVTWNLVKVDGQWYHLDAAVNDITTSKQINYQYFLASNTSIKDRKINYGGITSSESWGSKFKEFQHIVNPAEVGNILYYADAEIGGAIKKLEIGTATAGSVVLTEATSGYGNIVYYKRITGDSASPTVTEELYFRNDTIGGHLYKYDLTNKKLSAILNEPITSIHLEGPSLMYIKGGSSSSISLSEIGDFNSKAAKTVIDAITKLTPDADFKRDLIEVRKKYNQLTADQKELVINYKTLTDYEDELIDDSIPKVKSLVDAINKLDVLDIDYVDAVEKANMDLLEVDKNKIYNYQLLVEANTVVGSAKALDTEIDDLVKETDTEKYLKNIKELGVKFDELLPSLKKAINPIKLIVLNSKRVTIQKLLQEVDALKSNVNLIDDNSAGYLAQMALIKTQMTSIIKQVESLKLNLNGVVDADIENNIKEHLGKSENANTVVGQLEKLDYKQYDSLDNIEEAVKEVEEAVKKISNADVIISSTLLSKLKKYREDIGGFKQGDVEDVSNQIGALTKDTPVDDIKKVRETYDKLNEIEQFLVGDLTKLVVLEKHITDAETEVNDTNTADKWVTDAQVILDKEGKSTNEELLEEIGEFSKTFSGLSLGAKGKVEAVKINLEKLKEKIELAIKKDKESLATTTAEAKKVTDSIKALKASSKKEEIGDARKAYDALSTLAKSLVTEATLKLLVDAEKALADKEKEEQDKKQETEDKARALELDNAILAIAADTLLEDIEALYANYGALSATVKAHMKEGKKLETIVEQRRKQEVKDIEIAKDQAKLVDDRIAKITANYTEAQIRNIRTAYAALSARAKTYVTNLASLGAAEANIIYQNTVVKEAKNEAAAFDTYMTNLDRTSSTADIAKARAYYNRLSAEARKHVTAYTKLERLETMWSNPDYQDLYNNYYPHYLDEIPAGGIEIGQTNHVSLYIPDDSDRNEDYTNFAYTELAPTTDHYMTTITAQQVRHMNDKTLTLTASDNIKISIPMEELKNTKGTIAVYANVSNGSLIVRFTEDNVVKTFSGFVEIKMPITELSMTTANLLERTTNTSSSTAVNYYFDGKDIVIRTKQSGTFTSKNNTEIYNDLFSVNTDAAKAIRELAKRDITSGAIGKSYLPNSTAKRKDIAIMIARAVDVTTTKETKYQDIQNLIGGSTIQALLETSIMKGKTATQFSPYANVTRQEGAIILANMLRYLNDDVTKAHNEQTSNYTDVKALTYEAKQSIAILEIAGVLDGKGEFDPTAQLTRAEFAEMLYKTMQNAKLL